MGRDWQYGKAWVVEGMDSCLRRNDKAGWNDREWEGSGDLKLRGDALKQRGGFLRE